MSVFCVPLSVHSLWVVPDVQRDREPPGQAAGVLGRPAFAALNPRFSGREWSFHPDICCGLQLLEDVEETLSCAMLEEDYLSRRLNCGYFTAAVLAVPFWGLAFSVRG